MAKFRPPTKPTPNNSTSNTNPKFKPKSNDRKPPLRQSLPDGIFTVEGSAAIREYLQFKPETVKKIFSKEKQVAAIRQEFSGFKVHIESVKETAGDEGDRSLPATPVWAHVHHEMMSWTDFEGYVKNAAHPNETILALDHISDPRNLGAIVRSAAFFGVTKIIVPERRQVLLTPSAVGTAQGGFALCDLVVVVNLSRALDDLKEKGFWILGAAMGGSPVDQVRGRYERQVIVLGSEDKGISPNVLGRCDVQISIAGAQRTLDSLNVSVAAGILLQRLIVLP